MPPRDLVRGGLSCVTGLSKWVTGGFGKSGLGEDRIQKGVGVKSMEGEIQEM